MNNRVRELRKGLKMSQAEFAELCDISIVSVSRYESGGNIDRRNIEKIAKACHVSLESVLDLDLTETQVYDRYPVLAPEDIAMVADYRTIPDRMRRKIRELINDIALICSEKSN